MSAIIGFAGPARSGWQRVRLDDGSNGWVAVAALIRVFGSVEPKAVRGAAVTFSRDGERLLELARA